VASEQLKQITVYRELQQIKTTFMHTTS